MRSVGPTSGAGTTEHAAGARERGSESGVPRSLPGVGAGTPPRPVDIGRYLRVGEPSGR